MSQGGALSLAGLREVMDQALRPPVLSALLGLMVAVTLLLAGLNILTTQGPTHADGSLCCGDFTAFWTGGWLVANGHGPELYDIPFQIHYQQQLVANDAIDAFQPYNYPPTLALVVAPMVGAGYRGAFALFGLFNAVMLGLGLASVWPHLQRMSPLARVTGLLAVVGYAPVLSTMLGGQTSALTLALFCLHYGALRSGRLLLAGVALGLLAYKPQFTVVLALWHLWQRDLRLLGAAFACGLLQLGLGALVVGADWPLLFLGAVKTLSASSSWQSEGGLFLSFPGALRWTFGEPGRLLGWGGAGGLWWLWARAGRGMRSDAPRFPVFYALMLLLGLLGGPYAMYYDNAIIALAVLLLVDQAGGSLSLGGRALLALGWLAYPLYALGPDLGLQPLFVEMLALYLWSVALLRSSALD